MAENFCKYYKLIRQVSYNSGQTWSNVDPPQYQQGDLYEAYSSDCAPQAMYRWVVLDESETMCENGIGHYVEHKQVSVDYGETWVNVEPEETQLGAEKTLEESMDCFRYHFNNGNPYTIQKWEACKSEDDYIAHNEDILDGYYNHKIPSIEDYTTGQYDLYIGNCVHAIYGSNSETSHQGGFNRYYQMVKCYLPETLEYLGERIFIFCISLREIIIPNSVTQIGEGCFEFCSSLRKAILPSGLTVIPNRLFNSYYYVPSYTSEYYPNLIESVGYIGSESDLEIPSGITSIGEAAFQSCTNLKFFVNLPNLTSIGHEAFMGCTGLTSFNIPSGCTSIGISAFNGCKSLVGSVVFPNGTEIINGAVFNGCSGITSVTIPSGVSSIGDMAFGGCHGLTNINVPDSVTTIGESAFNNCITLTSVTIGSGITYIDDNAFDTCRSLLSITIKATTPPEIYDETVFRNTNNCPIYVPASSVNAYKSANYWYRFADRIQAIS